MGKLMHLPNISRELEEKLLAVGIDSPDKLREKGSRNVFVKIKTMDSGACYNMLLSIEGAVQGKIKEELDEGTRTELKRFMEIFNQ
ncbi:MAG: TfoX/Sxy family DNA transformation protein [Bacteroidales bacterium]